MIGFYRDQELIYVARVRNGFVPATRRMMFEKLKPLVQPECPFVNLPETHKGRWGQGLTADKMRKRVWVRPELAVRIEFLEWTDSDHLRHAKFAVLRTRTRRRWQGTCGRSLSTGTVSEYARLAEVERKLISFPSTMNSWSACPMTLIASRKPNLCRYWAVDKFLSPRTQTVIGFRARKITPEEDSRGLHYPSRSRGKAWSVYRLRIAPQQADPTGGSPHDSRPRP